MAQSPEEQQRKDAQRIGDTGTGKLDRDATADAEVAGRASEAETDGVTPTPDAVRSRLARDRDAAVEQLRRLGISPEADPDAPRGVAESVLDEGDQAQASERQDVGFAVRARLAERINRLTAALERLQSGTYGHCSVCGGPIEPARLAAVPDADTCLRCQRDRERVEGEAAA